MNVLLFILLTLPVLWSKTVLVMGDSLTEGYHLAKEEAYPFLLEADLRKTHPDLKIINGGISGSTTASAMKRLDWYLKARPEIMLLALGANDGLRGMKVEETRKNLEKVIRKARDRGITVVLGGMKLPPNYGKAYTDSFNAIFPALAREHKLLFIPFILEGVAGNPKLNLPDGIHPNPEGHKVIARTVKKFLEPLL